MGFNQTLRKFLLIHLTIFEASTLTLSLLFLSRIQVQPIKARSPYLVLFYNFTTVWSSILITYDLILPQVRCSSVIFALYLFFVLEAVSLVRAFKVWFQFHMALEYAAANGDPVRTSNLKLDFGALLKEGLSFYNPLSIKIRSRSLWTDADSRRLTLSVEESRGDSDRYVELHEEQEERESRVLWFSTRKHWISNMNLWLYVFVILIVLWIPAIVFWSLSRKGSCLVRESMTTLAALEIIILILKLFLEFQVYKDVTDLFWLRKETILIIFGQLVLVLVFLILTFTQHRYLSIIDGILILFLYDFVLLVSTFYPIYLSFRNSFFKKASDPASLYHLQELLEFPDGYQAFEKFLIGEFSVENLHFIRDVSAYEEQVKKAQTSNPLTIPTIVRLLKLEAVLYNHYIAKNCPIPINISFPARRSSESYYSKFQELKNDIECKEHVPQTRLSDALNSLYQAHSHAKSEIIRLLTTDSFQRFKNSLEFKQVADKFENMKKTREALHRFDSFTLTETSAQMH